MITALLLALNLAPSSAACHTTAIIKLHHDYSDKQVDAIVSNVFPPWAFVVCGYAITDHRQSVEVRYGPQQRHIPST